MFYLDIRLYKIPNENTKVFIEKIKECFDIDLSTNPQTIMRVSNVLRVGNLKQEYNFYENKEIYQLSREQKDKYKKIKEIVYNIFPKFYSEDIVHLGIILKKHLAFSSLENKKYKRIVIVDDTFDHMYGKILSKYLKNFSYIEVVEIIESYEINSLLEDVFEINYIITIDDLQNFKLNIPVIKVNRELFLDDNFELSQLSLILK